MSNNEDEEEMQKAFEQFMISGRNSKDRSRVEKVDVQNKSPVKHKNTQKEEVVSKKVEKKYWQILNAFQGTLKRDWLEVDDNLEGVVSSIYNLRSRIYMESRQLYRMKNRSIYKWNGCGYRANGEGGLTVDDVELAMSHDLLQHEKMMAGARMLLSSLSEAQEALGRRLDELLLHHMDALYLVQNSMTLEVPDSMQTIMASVDKLQQVFTSLALELYRKQLLVQEVLDAFNDDLFFRDDDDDEDADAMDVNPRRVADKCLREWPRGSKASHVNATILDGLLTLGE